MTKSVFSKLDVNGVCYDVIESNSVIRGRTIYLCYMDGLEIYDPQQNEEDAIYLMETLIEEAKETKEEHDGRLS